MPAYRGQEGWGTVEQGGWLGQRGEFSYPAFLQFTPLLNTSSPSMNTGSAVWSRLASDYLPATAYPDRDDKSVPPLQAY